MRRPRHCDDGLSCRERRPRGANDGQQLCGVCAAIETELEHLVVCGVFALSAERALRHPEQGMKPIGRTRNLDEHMNEPVGAPDMSEFVAEHGAQPLLLPLTCGLWQEHLRTTNTPRQRNHRVGTGEQSWRASDAEGVSRLAQNTERIRIGNRT